MPPLRIHGRGVFFLVVTYGVPPKNGGIPKWIVLKETPMKMDDSGVSLFQETTICGFGCFFSVYVFGFGAWSFQTYVWDFK